MAQTTIVEALSSLAKVYGVDEKAITPADTSAELIQLIAGGVVFGSSNVTASSPNANTEYWGTKVSAMQTSVAVANGAVTGTLHKLTSGHPSRLVSDLQRALVLLSLMLTWMVFSRSQTRMLRILRFLFLMEMFLIQSSLTSLVSHLIDKNKIRRKRSWQR